MKKQENVVSVEQVGQVVQTKIPQPKVPKLRSKKIPVTQEGLAVLIGQGKATDAMKDIFFESIKKCIFLIINRHMVFENTRLEFDDIANDMWEHIQANIHKYNPKKGKVTTWVWSVVRNKLLRKRGKWQRHCRTHSLVDTQIEKMISEIKKDPNPIEAKKKDPGSWKCTTIEDLELRMDFRETVLILLEKHEGYEKEIKTMFGDPNSDDCCIPDTLNFVHVARSIGVKWSRVRDFYRRHCLPLFIRRHGDDI